MMECVGVNGGAGFSPPESAELVKAAAEGRAEAKGPAERRAISPSPSLDL